MVTDYGIEAVVANYGSYYIEASRLTETTERVNGTFYDWPIHMEEKGECLDLNAFIAAFAGALAIHAENYQPNMDRVMLKRSILEALGRRKRNGKKNYD